MNALEIYPSFSWWLCGTNAEELAALRAGLDAGAVEMELNRKAYFLVGDAASFELIPHAFDEVVVHYEPTPLKRLVLERNARQWLKESGVLRILSAPREEVITEVADWAGAEAFHT